MLDIGSTFYPNQIWTNIKSFFTTDGITVVLYKRNLLISVNFSLENSSCTFNEKSTQEIENDIINIFHTRNQILVLDTCGNIFHYNTTSATDVLQKIAHIPSGRLVSACVLNSSPIIMWLSYDNHQKMSVQSYNLETRSVKSGAFIKLSNISITTRFIMTPVTMGDTEMVLIGCPDGSVVQYSADCSHFEILHQCTECIVDIFQTDVIYFILSDGRLLEYNNGQVCLKYLPHCVPKRCLHIHPFSLVYSDDHSTFLYNLNESTDEKLAVKGVINMSHCSGHLFLLTIQGMVYVLSDSTTDQFQRELENAYKFTLHQTHSCDGVTFSPDSWSCYITLANQNVVLPLSIRLGSGDMMQMMFVLTEYQPAPYVNMKVYLISGSHSQLRLPVCDTVLTLLSFCAPSPLPPHPSPPLSHTRHIPLQSDQGDILHRILMDIRHAFTRDAWNKIAEEKVVLLKFGKELIELCADDRSRELLVKSTSEEVLNTVARVIQGGFISAGFLYSDYLHLNSVKQQAEIERFESDSMDLPAITSRVNQLASV
ncbi:hypothetical protein M8J75_001054 [Diaphorina citri]|nr:hypothetical protein M8J75_001054 [Diaphorina citri]